MELLGLIICIIMIILCPWAFIILIIAIIYKMITWRGSLYELSFIEKLDLKYKYNNINRVSDKSKNIYIQLSQKQGIDKGKKDALYKLQVYDVKMYNKIDSLYNFNAIERDGYNVICKIYDEWKSKRNEIYPYIL